jgi:zinc protease
VPALDTHAYHRRRRRGAAVTLAFGWVIALTSSAAASAPVSADVATFRLDNGVTVVVAPRRTSPVIAVQAWVGAGAADESPGQAGIAHLVEHMLFKGTARRGVGELTQAIEAAGGDLNAWTSFDHTVYHAVLGRGDLDTGLDVLADALIEPTFDEDELAREREVVVEEIRQGQDDPARTTAAALFATAFVIHPYRRPVIGTIATVRALRRDDLVAWHRAHHVARDLTVVVAGDVDPIDARRRVARYFDRVPDRPVPRLRPTEPAQIAPRAVVVHHHAAEAHVAIGFHAPALRDADTPLLDLAAVALGQGDSSRLAALRHRDDIATGVVAHLQAFRDPGLFVVSAVARPERVVDTVAAISRELVAAADDLGAAELDRARNAVLGEQIWQRETAEGLARKYGWHHSAIGDVGYDRAYLDAVKAASVDDVRAVIGRALRLDGASVAAVVPPRVRVTPARVAQALTRKRASKKPRRKAPAVTREVLDNGMTVLVMRDPAVAVVAMRAVWPGGTRLEDDRTSGTTALLASAITRGCGDRDGAEVATEVDRLAGGIAGVGGRNSFGVRAEWLSSTWREGLDLFADCVVAPRLDADEVDRQRRLLLDDLAARAASGSHQAFRLFAETLYGDHPYRLDVLGDPDAVADLTPRKLRRFYRDHYPASAMTLAIVGDVDPDQVIEQVRARFGDLPRRAPRTPKVATARFDGRAASDRESYRYLAREQAHLVVGFPGTTVDSPDRFAVEVLTTILGGQSGRLFAELRDRQGLAYRVSAFSVDGLDPGYLAVYVSCGPDKATAVAQAIRDEIDRIVADGVSDEEVARAIQHLTGAHAVAMQRRSAIANALAFHEAYGLGWNSWTRYADDLAAVDAAAVARAARAYLRWDVAVTATVRPPAMTRGAKQRAAGKVKKAAPTSKRTQGRRVRGARAKRPTS